MTTETPAAPTPPSSPAPAAPQPSSSAPAATPPASPASTPSATPATPTAPSPAPVAATRPADLPEAFWNAAKNEIDTAAINAVVVRDAANESRRLALPQKAEDVSLDLPKDFKLPAGVEFKFDPAKPEYNKFRDLVVSEGLSQATATKLTGLFAEIMVGDQASMQQFEAAEMTKLGANGPARATAIKTALTSMIGEGLATHLQVMTRTAGGVQAMEAIVAKFSSQGVAPMNAGGREPSLPAGKVSDEQYAKMTDAQKLNYVRGFDQGQFQKSA